MKCRSALGSALPTQFLWLSPQCLVTPVSTCPFHVCPHDRHTGLSLCWFLLFSPPPLPRYHFFIKPFYTHTHTTPTPCHTHTTPHTHHTIHTRPHPPGLRCPASCSQSYLALEFSPRRLKISGNCWGRGDVTQRKAWFRQNPWLEHGLLGIILLGFTLHSVGAGYMCD